MPETVAEPALTGLRLNLRIVSVVIFNFASYLTIGLPLAVLPGYVHDVMGFSAFWAGLVISLQYFATLLSRPMAGRMSDNVGTKRAIVLGLAEVTRTMPDGWARWNLNALAIPLALGAAWIAHRWFEPWAANLLRKRPQGFSTRAPSSSTR